ncbi:MAG: ribonuclease H-like YkuK family protein [Desulfotomaculaceae bacterium]|nr:ribonuclease H-like YkuK family protein [Desulfotomaculaceae bacterium]
MNFISPTKGRMDFDEMMTDIIKYIKGLPTSSYKIIIGSDSMVKTETCFITAVIVHRLGKGARYFYRKKIQRKIKSLRQKIFYETALSLEVGGLVHTYFADNGFVHLNVEIHIDVGVKGETKDLIREVVGMVTGSGFTAKIKPEAYGASSVADKHTK